MASLHVLIGLLGIVCSLLPWPVIAEEDKVLVDIYYESFDTESMKFFKDQLYPTLHNSSLLNNVTLNLIPFGRGNVTVTCANGQNVCNANKLQACALLEFQSELDDKILDFIYCFMTNADAQASPPIYTTKGCDLSIAQQNVTNIENCANSENGTNALVQLYEKSPESIRSSTSFPKIIFNKQVEQTGTEAVTNFKKVLCSLVLAKNSSSNNTIEECHDYILIINNADISTSSSTITVYVILIVIVKFVLISALCAGYIISRRKRIENQLDVIYGNN